MRSRKGECICVGCGPKPDPKKAGAVVHNINQPGLASKKELVVPDLAGKQGLKESPEERVFHYHLSFLTLT